MSKQKGFPKIDKQTIREITNQSKNALAGRLFRNSSLGQINPNISMLSSSQQDYEPSFLNSSASTNQLVASISLRKLKNKFHSDRYPKLEISNGKLLINKSNVLNDTLSKDSPKAKHMFKKLDKLTHQPMNRILPNDLIDFPIENELEGERKVLKKAAMSPFGKPKRNKFIDDKEDLLPEDFIQLLENQKGITNEFCYLKKMDHPYDLKIIQFDKNLERKSENDPIQYPSEYITISSRGVTYFSEDQSRFVSLQEWKREASYFKKIIKLDFFKNFKVIKNFSNWKKCLRKSAMNSTKEKLQQALVYNDLFLSKSLLKIREICYIMETDVSYCRLDECQQALDIDSYKQSHLVFLEHHFQKKITDLEENIKEVLMSNMSLSMKWFKEENKISSSIEGKGMPLLIGDEKNLQMPYTKEATLRTQQQKFQKYIKLVDLIITHSKVNMMAESTTVLVKKIEEENQNYQRQVVNNNYKNTFKGKQYLQCVLTLNHKQQQLFLQPTKQDLKSLFETIVTRSVIRICKNHKKINADIDVLSIIYDSQQQFPKQSESETLKLIMNSDNREQLMLKSIMDSLSVSYNYILTYVDNFRDLTKTYYQNERKFEQIFTFQAKDYETIAQYLQEWQKQKQTISKITNEHEGPVLQVSLKKFKQEVERKTDECIKEIKLIIPKIFQESIRQLGTCLRNARSAVENKPAGIKQLIVFNENLNQITVDIEQYSDRMAEITCLQILMRNITPSSSESNYKKLSTQTKQLQSSLNRLRDQIDKAEKENKNRQGSAQDEVKKMVPQNKQRLAQLYTHIEKLAGQEIDTCKMLRKIQSQRNQLTDIMKQLEDIKTYQRFLSLEESTTEQIQNFNEYFTIFEKIWTIANQFDLYFNDLQERPYNQISVNDVNIKIEQFITTDISLEKQIKILKQKDFPFHFSVQDNLVLKQMMQKIELLKPLIQTIECLMDPALGQKQWKEILGVFQHRNPKIKQILETDRAMRKPKDLIAVSAANQLPHFKSVVAKAKKSNQISHKLESIKSSKLNQGFFKNLTQKFKQNSEILLEQLDEKIMTANFVIEQSENYENEKAKSEKIILQKLKQMILLWEKYEQHVQYFEPIYLLTDWKNTSEGKLFISATEQNWKKTYKSFKDSNLSKIYSAEKILIASLKQSNDALQSLYPGVSAYFNTKRLQCPKFCFLSDSEIIKIYEQSKDFKGLNNYISAVFPTLQSLVFKDSEVVPFQAINLDGQVLSIKISKSSNEVEQILKIVDESIKSGIKMCIKSCEKGYKSEQFNRISWIKENLTQVLVLVSSMFFTHIIQSDYLIPDRYDIDQLLTYHESQIQNLKKSCQQKADVSFYKKLLVLLTQSIYFRDIILELKLLNIKSPESYTWLKHIRTSYESEPVQIEYLNVSIPYGNQFVCMESNPLLITTLSEKAIVQTVNSMIGCNNVPIVCKSYLSQLAIFNAKPYNNICLLSGQETRLIQATIEGTWLSGSFTDFTLSKNLSIDQLRQCARLLQQIQLTISLKDSHMSGIKILPLCKEAGICIISKDLINSPQLKECKFDYRVVSLPQVSWNTYLSLLLNVNNLEIVDFADKLAKIIVYLENCIKNFQLNRQDVKTWIQQAAQESDNQTYIIKTILKRILKIYGNDFNKKIINKLFLQFFGLTNYEKLLSYKSIRDCQGSDQQINKIVSSLKDNKICILSGQNSEFKQFIVYSVRKNFSNTQPRYMIIKQQSISRLYGSFNKGKWTDNIFTKRIKQTFNSKQCFVISGDCSKLSLSILQRLNSSNNKNNFLNLQNGSQIRLGQNQKIILLTQSNIKDPIFDACTISSFDLDSIKSIPEQIFDYLTKIKVNARGLTIQKRFFSSNQESLNRLHNLFLNNIQKISSSSLKMIGYKSEYNQVNFIMSRFVLLLSSVLEKDKQRICVNNHKMMEKLYVWCLYWAIASNMPKRCIQRVDKLFDSIKIECDKSQSLIQSKFSIFESNLTVYKFIKGSKIFKNYCYDYLLISPQLEAKKQIIKNLININASIMLLGDKNSGKSAFVDYLAMNLENEGFMTVKTKVTKNTTAQLFMEWLKPNIYLQSTCKEVIQQRRISSANGKKLIIFVDNFNLIDVSSSLYSFFESAISLQYIYDAKQSVKIVLDNICFVCIKNSCFESIEVNHSFMLPKIFPIYVNQQEFFEIIGLYAEDIQDIVQQDKRQLMGKILPSIATLHQFSANIITSQKSSSQRFLSYQVPIWIAKQLIRQAKTSGTVCNDLITLWKYLSLKKYIASGLLQEFQEQFKNQLSNVVSLVVKSSPDSETALKQERDIVSQIFKRLPLLQLKFDQTDYYTYMTYLLRSDQFRHLVSHSCYTSGIVKGKALKFICESLDIKFSYPKDCLELSNVRKSCNRLIYIDGSQKELLQEAFAAIVQQGHNNDITFIIDLPNEADLGYYLRFNPNVDGLAHIYNVKPVTQSNSHSITNYQQIDDLLSRTDISNPKQYADLFYLISQKADEIEQKIAKALKNRNKILLNSINNFNSLKSIANQSSSQINTLSQQIEQLTRSEESLQQSKAQLVDALSAIKRKADGNPQQKESLGKRLGSIDAQLKKIKNSKNDKSEAVARLKQANSDKIEATRILAQQNQTFEKDHQICSCLLKQQSKYNYFKIMQALLHLRQSNQKISTIFDKVIDLSVQKIGFTLAQIFSALVNIKLTHAIGQRYLVEWVLSNYEYAFVTNDVDALIYRLQTVNPQLKLCLNQYEVNQCIDLRPIVVKEQIYAKGPKVSLICSSEPQRPFIRVTIESKMQSTLNKIEFVMSEAIKLREKYELEGLENEFKRFQLERQSLKIRLTDKTLVQKTSFLGVNNLSDIKQIADAEKALNTRFTESRQKIDQLEQTLNSKFGKIKKVVTYLVEYFAYIAQRYSYIRQNHSLLVNLISSSLVIQQPIAECQSAQNPQPKQINESETIRNIFLKSAKWMSLSLTSTDFISSIFLLSCVKLTLDEQMPKQNLEFIYQHINSLQTVYSQELAVIKHESVRQILEALKAKKTDLLFTMLESSSNLLGLDLRNIINTKQQWITGLRQTFLINTDCSDIDKKVFLVLGSLEFNSYKLIDNQIRKYLNGDQSVIYLSNQEDVDHRIELLEKTPLNQQGWLVLKNWNETSKINRLLAYTLNKKSFKTVVFFDSMLQLIQAKTKLDVHDYYQICLHDHTKSICYQVKELYKTYNLIPSRNKQNPNVNKLLKCVLADQVSKLCKGLLDPVYKFNSFDCKVFESWVQRTSQFYLPDFILYTLDYVYKATSLMKQDEGNYLISINENLNSDVHTISKSRTFLRECKRLMPKDEKRKKTEEIHIKQEGNQSQDKHQEASIEQEYTRFFDIDVYDYSGVCELYSLFSESSQTMKNKISTQDSLKKLITSFLPKDLKQSITVDMLFGFEPQQQQRKIMIQEKGQFNRKQACGKLNNILQTNLVMNKQQQVDKFSTLTMQMLKSTKKNIQFAYSSSIQKVKRLLNVLQSNFNLSERTEKQRSQILYNQNSSLIQMLTKMHNKIAAIQKQIESKEINLEECLMLVNQPRQFLYTFILELTNVSKLSYANSKLQIKCLTDKEKENGFREINKYENLTNVRIVNGKIDIHKYCVLEAIQLGEISKPVSIVLNSGSKQQIQSNYRLTPLIINGVKVIDISIATQAKQVGFWNCEVSAMISEKDEAQKQMKQLKQTKNK